MCSSQIDWDERLMMANPQFEFLRGCVGVLDGTFCPVQVSRERWVKKAATFGGQQGYKYLVVVRLNDGRVIWVSPPAFASFWDGTIANHSELLDLLQPGETLLADLGFAGVPHCILKNKGALGRIPEGELFNRVHSSFRIIIERLFARTNAFLSVSTPWRHDPAAHPFPLVCRLVNQDLLYHPL